MATRIPGVSRSVTSVSPYLDSTFPSQTANRQTDRQTYDEIRATLARLGIDIPEYNYNSTLDSTFPTGAGVGPLEASSLSSELTDFVSSLQNATPEYRQSIIDSYYNQPLESTLGITPQNIGDLDLSSLSAITGDLSASTGAQSTVQPTGQRSKPGNFFDFLTTDPSVLADQDITGNLYSIGKALGTNPNSTSITDKSAARTGKALSLIGNTGSAAIQAFRTILSGRTEQKRYQEQLDNYYNQIRKAQEGAEQYLKGGGQVKKKKMAQGGTAASEVEVERGEILKDPDGNIEKVKGKKHSEGGEKRLLDVGTEVTSDNRKIGKKGVEQFKELFSNLTLNLKPTDTYADVFNKVDKKIDIAGTEEEIVRLSNKLEGLSRDDINTYNLNSNYLINKISQLNSQKEILETSRLKAIDTIFDVQEASKGNSTSSSAMQQMFEEGGVITDNQLEILSRKTKLPIDYLRGTIARTQRNSTRKMAEGGRVAFERILNSFATPDYNSQRLTDTPAGNTSGSVTADTFTDRVRETLRIFPKAIEYFNLSYDDAGNITDIEFKNKNSVKDYQNYVNRVYNNISKYADKYIDNPTQRDQLKDYVKGLQFDTKNSDSVRFSDNIFGDFTSSRSGVALPLVTSAELEKLSERGITNFSQLFDENGEIIPDVLVEETAKNINQIREDFGNDFDATLLAIGQQEVNNAAQPPVTPIQETQQQNNELQTAQRASTPGDDLNGIQTNPAKSSFVLPYLPNQYRYDFDTPQEHLRQSVSYGRLSPISRDYTAATEAIYTTENAGLESLRGYADPQRLAGISNVVAQSTAALNQVIAETEAWNVTNRQNAQVFNIGQADRESDAQRQENRTYEELTLRAIANTDQNNDRIRDYNRRVRLGNYNTVNRLRTINNIVPNYGVDRYGGIYYQGGDQPFSTGNGDLTLQQLIALTQSQSN